jgi:hypothetical protein
MGWSGAVRVSAKRRTEVHVIVERRGRRRILLDSAGYETAYMTLDEPRH